MFSAAGVADGSGTEAVQLHVAPGDDFFDPDEEAEALRGFEKAGIRVERYEYPGLGHWFAEVGSPAYDEEGTRLATAAVADVPRADLKQPMGDSHPAG